MNPGKEWTMRMRRATAIVMTAAAGGLWLAGAPAGTPTAPATTMGTRRGAPAPPAADQPSPRMGRGGTPDANWALRHDRLVARARQGDVDLYMLGDSITDNWQNGANRANWNLNLAGWKAADFGIGGDRTEHVLYRIANGELDGVKPKAIVLMIGTNNLGTTSAADTANGVKAIVKLLEEKQPQARILLLAIFPRNALASDPLRMKVNETNDLLAKMEWGRQVKFMNINDKFLDKDGNLSRDIMPDRLHPNAKGYQIWADAIAPTLTEWLGPLPATAPASQPATRP